MGSSIWHNLNRFVMGRAYKREPCESVYLYANHPDLLGRMETLRAITDNDVGVVRFGDGELAMALMGKQIDFQRKDRELIRQLEKLLYLQDQRVLPCLNNEFARNSHIPWLLRYERSKKRYAEFESIREPDDVGVLSRKKEYIFYNECYRMIFGSQEPSRFGDATVFMLGLYVDAYRAGNLEEVTDRFTKLFKGRRLMIVCPRFPLMAPSFSEIEHRLRAAGAKAIAFVDVPESHAYDHYDRIKKEILGSIGFDAVWIQAGPAATVLAADLATNHDVLAYDIGSFNTTLQYLV